VGAGFYRPLAQALSCGGCIRVRQGKGSHEIWYSPITRRNFSVSTTVASAHTANAALIAAGLPKQF
jgi:hypothetical protein